MNRRNEEMMTIPAYMFERLLQAYYFEQACRYYNIEGWERYEQVELYKNQLAVNDIMKDNQE
jgi:hypothetical protein